LEEIEKNRLGLQLWLNGGIDATNLNALAIRSGLPSTVFHLAGGSSVGLSISQPHEDFFRTVVSTARLLEWLRGSAPECRLISVSSAAVYGANYQGPISEDALTLPMSPYGQHKLVMEQLCRSYATTFGLRSMVTRLFSVYGPNLRKQLLWDLCSRLHRGDRTLVLAGTGAEMRDWTDVRDVARFLMKVNEGSQSRPFEVINGGSGIGTSVADIAGVLVRNWSGNVAVKFSGVVREGDPFSLVADSTLADAAGFVWQIPVAKGLSDYVSWFKDHVR
jgi:UDP-glucose 4-epimerase